MKRKVFLLLFAFAFFLATGRYVFAKRDSIQDEFVSYIADIKKQEIRLYWKDEMGENFSSIQRLKSSLEKKHQKLLFAMNAGMYKPDHSPPGLYVENKVTLSNMDTASGSGNFFLKPNGVFYITSDNVPAICNTANFVDSGKIKYATQSGPMLVIDGKIHPAFKEGSANLNIRNGVGILPDNKVIFAMSKKEINFYDFASYFKNIGCKNALYLDGLVSRTYLPDKKWIQTDGNFGVMIGILEKSN